MKTISCGYGGKKDATIDDCINCSRMCVNNPNYFAAMHWDGRFTRQWGADEVERCIKERRQNYRNETRQETIG